MSWFKLNKQRSKLGKFIDSHGINQQLLARRSNISKTTISKLCKEDRVIRNRRTGESILKALRELTESKVEYDDLWK